MKSKRKVKMLKGEKVLYAVVLILAVTLPLLSVFSQAKLTESNIEVEKYRSKIAKQTDINDSINMKINELASLDKIQDIANETGLSYNNDNIKVISNRK